MTESETRESATAPEPDDELRELVALAKPLKDLSRFAFRVHRFLTTQLQAKSAGTPDPRATVAEQRHEIEKLIEKVRGLEDAVADAETYLKARGLDLALVRSNLAVDRAWKRARESAAPSAEPDDPEDEFECRSLVEPEDPELAADTLEALEEDAACGRQQDRRERRKG